MRIDSVAQTATLTSLAFFLSSSLSAVSGVPIYPADLAGANTMEPWVQPCGTPLAAALKKIPQRHSVHRALKWVRTQLRVAQNHFRKELKDVHEIYSKVYKVLKEQYRVSWLPEKQLEWYHKEVWCLEKARKAEWALPKLHDALQRFAITFYHLKTFDLKSNINTDLTMNRRNKIIDGMYNQILRILCEVETAILNLGLQLPMTHKANIVTESSNWAKEGDLTTMLIQDWGVIRLYQVFLNDWTRAFRNATATGPGTCDPSKVKPLNLKPKNGKKIVTNGKRPMKGKKQIEGGRRKLVAVFSRRSGKDYKRRLNRKKQKKVP